jgi:ribosome-binding ATPase
MLRTGIVGLPNVGKSTLFNAVTRSHKAEAANYPFCTIEPNVGVVTVPDDRLEPLSRINKTPTMIPTAIEFFDIAGLVAGASKGEGLGNQFLSNIREVDAIIHVVRCFEDPDVVHPMPGIDPVRDIEVINTELILSDIETCARRHEKAVKKAHGHDKEGIAELALLDRLKAHLNAGKPANTLHLEQLEQAMLKTFFLLTSKPVLYAANVAESDIADPSANPHVARVAQYAREHLDSGSTVICAKLEADLVDLSPDEAREMLAAYGVTDSGVSAMIRNTYSLLGLITFLTMGEKEVRAWTVRKGWKAPQAAGVIHTDFEKGFIKAEVVSFPDLVAAGTVAHAREHGKYRLEGRDYVIRDGDVVLFRFNV